MSVEEKAVEYVADCGVMVPIGATTAEAREVLFKEMVAMYLAGHAEALRFRTVEEERPPLSKKIAVQFPTVQDVGTIDHLISVKILFTENQIDSMAEEGITWHRL